MNYIILFIVALIFGSHCHSGLDPESILSCPSCTSWLKSAQKMLQNCHKSKTNPKRTQTNPIFPRPNPILSEIIGILDNFMITFLCKTNPMVCYRYSNFFLMNYNIIPFLARSFFRIQGLGRIQNGSVPMYCEYLNLGRIRRDREKESPKSKTKPIQSQTKPIFWRPNPILSPKMRIFDKFMKTFLCKTKPFFSKIQIKNKGLTAV